MAISRRSRTAKKSVPRRKLEETTVVIESAPEVKLAKCRDCNKPFELPKTRGRPPVRCPACREIHAAQTDTSKTTTERVAVKRAAKKVNSRPKQTVVAETVTDNADANHDAAREFARALRRTFMADGWAVVGKRDDDALFLSLTATRGNETLHMEWKGGKVVHAIGGDVSPKADAELGKRGTGGVKQFGLPFDPRSASNEEILAILANRKVTWENSLSGLAESDRFGVNGSMRASINRDGENRILTFIGLNGFRSFRLNSLRRVH